MFWTQWLVLLCDEWTTMGVDIDWDAGVALTSEMLTGANAPDPDDLVGRGRLRRPFLDGPETIPAGATVLMDSFATLYIHVPRVRPRSQ
jgi:hypothetical protein